MAVFNKNVFSGQNLSVIEDIDSFVLEETTKLAKNVLEKVVKRTPYRTGQAKRNWIVSHNTHSDEFIKVPEESPIPLVTAENIALTRGQFQIPQAKPYKLIYIQNNAPYIVRLNNGYSLQAPELYVDTAILQSISTGK